MTTPIPAGRGRWRLTLHNRQFAFAAWQNTVIAELLDARSRRIEQNWNQAAQLTFTMDGGSPEAALIAELQTDVMAWRWDEATGADVCVFRGIVTQSEDEVTEQSNVVIFTCHDYIAMMSRRWSTNTVPLVYSQEDQDYLANYLLGLALVVSSGNGTSMTPGSYLPMLLSTRNPDGTPRNMGSSGQLRDRTYPGSTPIGQTFDDLANVINGFDYDVIPAPRAGSGVDYLRVFYPHQGVTRTTPALIYGGTVAAFTRTVNSTDYANYVRVLGDNGSSDPNAAQLFSEAWNSDANNVTVNPVGLWMNADNAADVNLQATLDQKAAGDLALSGLLVPSYTLTLTPDAYTWGNPNMGDVVPLILQVGRLNVNTTIRVVGIAYAIGDDGDEDVELTVGRPLSTFTQLVTQADRDADALTRR